MLINAVRIHEKLELNTKYSIRDVTRLFTDDVYLPTDHNDYARITRMLVSLRKSKLVKRVDNFKKGKAIYYVKVQR